MSKVKKEKGDPKEKDKPLFSISVNLTIKHLLWFIVLVIFLVALAAFGVIDLDIKNWGLDISIHKHESTLENVKLNNTIAYKVLEDKTKQIISTGDSALKSDSLPIIYQEQRKFKLENNLADSLASLLKGYDTLRNDQKQKLKKEIEDIGAKQSAEYVIIEQGIAKNPILVKSIILSLLQNKQITAEQFLLLKTKYDDWEKIAAKNKKPR